MDLDIVCLREFETIPLSGVEVTLGFQDFYPNQTRHSLDCVEAGHSCFGPMSESVPNAFMAAPPRHPFFAYLIHNLEKHARDSFRGRRPHPNAATGPRFLTDRVREWHKMNRGGLRMLLNPVIYNSAWTDRRHWCGGFAAQPEERLTTQTQRLTQFAHCAARRPEAVLTSFWAHEWVTSEVGNGTHGTG